MGITTVWDVLFGTLATGIAAYSAAKIRKEWLVPLPAVAANALIIGAMLTWVMTGEIWCKPLILNIVSIGFSQTLSCYVLGMPLLKLFKRIKIGDILSQSSKK